MRFVTLKKSISELKSVNLNMSINFQESLTKIINQNSEIAKYDTMLSKLEKCMSVTEKLQSFFNSAIQMDSTDIFIKWQNYENMRIQCSYFRNFSFFPSLRSILEIQTGNFYEYIRKEAKNWVNNANEYYEHVGKSRIPVDKYLFDQRYIFEDDFEMKKVKIIYYISNKMNMRDEIIEIINKIRNDYFLTIENKSLKTFFHIFCGFFILEFYLSRISQLFHLKRHFYMKLLIEKEREQREFVDIFEIKEFYLKVVNFLKRYEFESHNVDEELKNIILEYFYTKRLSNSEFPEEIDTYISQGVKLLKELEYLDIRDILYKSIDEMTCNYLEEYRDNGLMAVENIQNSNITFQWRYLQIRDEILMKIKESRFLPIEKEIIKVIEEYPDADKFGQAVDKFLEEINSEFNHNRSTRQIVGDILVSIKLRLIDQLNTVKSSEKLSRNIKGNYAIFENELRKNYNELYLIVRDFEDESKKEGKNS